MKREKKTKNVARQAGTALISIVEDDPGVRAAFGNLLKAVGYQTAMFESGEAFLASSEGIDSACLILDVRMPGMSGLELQRLLALSGDRTPVVFVSAHADDDARRQALKAGATAFLRKPVSEADLLGAVETALERPAKQPSTFKQSTFTTKDYENKNDR